MAPKPKPKPAASSAASEINNATKPKPAKSSSSSVSATPNFNVSAAPTSTASLLGVSASDAAVPLVGDNSDILGNSTGARRTIGEAVEAITKMSPAQIDQLQQQLINAGVLTGKHRSGVADSATTAAFRTAVEDATRNGSTISGYLNSLSQSGIVSAASTAAPTLTDPEALAVELQDQFTAQGLGQVPQSELNDFIGQVQSKESGKDATRVSIDPTAEATLFAAAIAAKTPGATSKVEQSTDADIAKAEATFGVKLTDTEKANIAAQVTQNAKVTGSPDVNLLNQLVAGRFRMPTNPANLSGDAATLYNDLQKLSGQYLIPESATTIGNFVERGIRTQSYAGNLAGDTEAQFEDYLRKAASTLYPWLAQSTQNFQTVNPWDATSAYRTQISNVLGIGNPDAVDLTSTKYAPLLTSPDGVNPPSLQTMSEQLMTNPQYGYDESPNGIARGYNIGINLAKSLGVPLTGV